MLLKKLYRNSYILTIMMREKVLLYIYHIINVLLRNFIFLIGSSAIHIVTIYFNTNLLKATK